MTYQPTDEQVEALAIKEFERRGPNGPYGLPWNEAPKLDKDDYRRSARAHANSPEFQAVIKSAQAEGWAAALNHVDPYLDTTVRRGAMADNPYET